MGMMDLRSIIEGLLAKGYEGGYWDYKSDYPNPDKPEKFFCISSKFQVQ